MQTMQSYVKVALRSFSGQTILTGRDVVFPSPIIAQIRKGLFFYYKNESTANSFVQFLSPPRSMSSTSPQPNGDLSSS